MHRFVFLNCYYEKKRSLSASGWWTVLGCVFALKGIY